MTFRECWTESPVGRLHLVAGDDALVGLYLEDHARKPSLEAVAEAAWPVLRAARAQLAAWFRGERTSFDLPLGPRGTPFQVDVWRALTAIPHGETRTYAEIARAVGRPGAARAVGAANARNPISIVVPCHRVVGAGGALTGYAGGLDRKRWLLEHERAVAGPALTVRSARSRRSAG